MTSDQEELRQRWNAMWRRLGLSAHRLPSIEPLLRAYAEPQRAYHNLQHIQQCLREFDDVSSLCDNPAIVEAAIWYHDAIYDPRRADNEEESARLASSEMMDAGIGTELVEVVRKLILETKHVRQPWRTMHGSWRT